jgi:hypothetical protein
MRFAHLHRKMVMQIRAAGQISRDTAVASALGRALSALVAASQSTSLESADVSSSTFPTTSSNMV